MQKSSWLVAGIACTLCVGAGVLLFGNQNAGISGTNEVADRFITQLALETYRPGGIVTSDSTEGGTGENSGFVDLSLNKELVSSNSLVYKYKITVRNDGTQTATDFTVKDYKPSGWYWGYTRGGIINNNTVTRFVPSLGAGQSKILYVEIKRRNALLVNKTEICQYEGENGLPDRDSDPCTMGANGLPVEDDEDMVTILTGSTGASHLACVNQACVYVAGDGQNTCTNNSGCIIENTGNNNTGTNNTGTNNTGTNNTSTNNTGSHLACVNYACVPVIGAGPNTCTTTAHCFSGDYHSGVYFSGCAVGVDVNSGGRLSGGVKFYATSFQIYPYPPYPGYSYGSCYLYRLPSWYYIPLSVNPIYGDAFTNLQAGDYHVSCYMKNNATGQGFSCSPKYFSVP